MGKRPVSGTESRQQCRARFVGDSPLEGNGFEPVWAFPVKWSFLFFAGSLFGAGKPFFVPSPAIRVAERAEGVKGPKR
jgi:hypothetical protein